MWKHQLFGTRSTHRRLGSLPMTRWPRTSTTPRPRMAPSPTPSSYSGRLTAWSVSTTGSGIIISNLSIDWRCSVRLVRTMYPVMSFHQSAVEIAAYKQDQDSNQWWIQSYCLTLDINYDQASAALSKFFFYIPKPSGRHLPDNAARIFP